MQLSSRVQRVVAGYVRQTRGFNPNARWFLWSTIVQGLAFSLHGLFFNLYVDSSGYSREFLGELQSMPNLVALFGAIPAGALVDIIGRKRAMLAASVLRTLGAIGIVFAAGPAMLRVSTAALGVASALWMVSSSPFMMENSSPEERNALFSANFGLQTLVGFFGTFAGGMLPSLFAGVFEVGAESPTAYAATLGVTAVLSLGSILPLLYIHEPARPVRPNLSLLMPWRAVSDHRTAVKIFLPNLLISMGAAILIPYMNLFFKESFPITDVGLGVLFAVSAVITGVATLATPALANRWGRIRALVLTQLVSIPFLLVIGFVPVLWIAAIAFWIRGALMNMGNPLYSAFAMEQIPERERATVSGLMGMSWTIGWTIGPFVSGYLQSQPGIGFKPIFVITCVLYLAAVVVLKAFWGREDAPGTEGT